MLSHLRTKSPVILGLILLFVGIFAGERWGWYYFFPHFDKVLHTLGGLTVAWFALAVLQDDIKNLRASRQALVLVSITALVGVLWEFAEYRASFLEHSYPALYHYFHGGDLADTLGDLTADIAGGALFSLWALWKERS